MSPYLARVEQEWIALGRDRLAGRKASIPSLVHRFAESFPDFEEAMAQAIEAEPAEIRKTSTPGKSWYQKRRESGLCLSCDDKASAVRCGECAKVHRGKSLASWRKKAAARRYPTAKARTA